MPISSKKKAAQNTRKQPPQEDAEAKPNQFDRTNGPGPRDQGKGAMGSEAEHRLERRHPRGR